MSVGHRLSRLAADLRAMHDRLRKVAQFRDALEAKRIATELEQARRDLEGASAAEIDEAARAPTGVIDPTELDPEPPVVIGPVSPGSTSTAPIRRRKWSGEPPSGDDER